MTEDTEFVSDEEMLSLFNLPQELQSKTGYQAIRFESPDSNPQSRRSFVRGHACDIRHIDVRDCAGDTLTDQTIRLIRMFKSICGA